MSDINRIPLIFDSTANSIEEIPLGDTIKSDVVPQGIPLDGSVTTSKIANGVSITFGNGTSAVPSIKIGSGNSIVGVYSPSPGNFAISTAGYERFRIDENGNITVTNGGALPIMNPDYNNSKVNTLYVNQADQNATDDPTNDGGRLNKPFKTIERALLEAAKRSYKSDVTAARFEAFTIMVFPGEYVIDNRPGLVSLDGIETQDTWNTEALIEQNIYKFNPPTGGVIVPRGTSIVGYDLRKTVIRPKFVPNPQYAFGDSAYVEPYVVNVADYLETQRTTFQTNAFNYIKNLYPSITNISDICKRDIGYIVDAIVSDLRQGGNINSYSAGESYIFNSGLRFITGPDENTATLAAFNKVRDLMLTAIDAWNNINNINITLINNLKSRVSNELFAVLTGIISNPSTYTSLYTKIFETGNQTSIFKVTGGCYFWQMTFKDALMYNNAPVNTTPVYNFSSGVFTTDSNGNTISAANQAAFSHHKVVCFSYANQTTGTGGELQTYYSKIDTFDTTIDGGGYREPRLEEYQIVGPGTSRTTIDTVNSASPYIFNSSLRSIFGLCGMNADGNKVDPTSFKSMVVAQFTGISLQRDPNAFWQPATIDGVPTNTTNPSNYPIYADPNAEYKVKYRHFHIKAQNAAYIQVVSVFAVGYADQFITINGGDMSITNSNSNFGQIALRAAGNRVSAFDTSTYGKITALIPPKGISNVPTYTEFYSIDAPTTWANNNQTGSTGNQFSQNNLNNFLNGITTFKIYLDIPNINTYNDIPELIVESTDYYTGVISRKRYLTYGANNNLNLFRDYYGFTGTYDKSIAIVNASIESTDGGTNIYSTHIKLIPETTEEQTTVNYNSERQGYFWDEKNKKVYIKVNASYSDSQSFLNNYIFKNTISSIFTTTQVTNPDGSISIVSGAQNVQLLDNFTGFPSSLTVGLIVDNRSSSPNDLLWRVEYRIPKDNLKDSNGNDVLAVKPPEKRFIIKGTVPGYTNRLFEIYDVQEVTAWQKGVRDGIYYLTIIRADIDNFIDGNAGSYFNNQLQITRGGAGTGETYNSLSSLYGSSTYGYGVNAGLNYRVTSNINYLYPSVIEDVTTGFAPLVWNPPITDSRALVEPVIGTGTSGYRVKDLSVPNKRYYKSVDKVIKNIVYRNPENKAIPITQIYYDNTSGLLRVTTGATTNFQAGDYINIFGTTSGTVGTARVEGASYINSIGSGTTFYTNPQGGYVGTGITVNVGLGNTGYVYNYAADVYVDSVNGLYESGFVLISNNFNTNINGTYRNYNISTGTTSFRIVTPYGSGVSVAPANPNYGVVSRTPFADIPSLYSITAESVQNLAVALNLNNVRQGYDYNLGSYSQNYLELNGIIDVAPLILWDARNSYNSIAYPFNYSGRVRYGDGNAFSTNSDNTYGLNLAEADRKILCVSSGSTFNLNATASDLINYAPTVPLYRPSIIRASSHTWEYVGLGAGNYSTGFPVVQTRVLKAYEQYIAQGYENSGGFIASSGTNSSGDFYIGNQIIQAGGQSTVTLNVPKIRKSSESNYLDVSNIENRISNSVLNITSFNLKNSSAQSTLKGLSNFFNTAKLSVSDKANIQSLTVAGNFTISNNAISNGINFPQGDVYGYGFVKAAKPEKTGYLSTDTNDKLYVSPKFLDAWRVKRQLVSTSNIQLDNNRIYVQSLSSTVLDGSNIDGTSTTSAIAISTGSSYIRVKESNGLPSYGSIDVEMNLYNVEFYDKDLAGYKFNPKIYITLQYDSIDYSNNTLHLSPYQNKYPLATYLTDIIGTGNTYSTIIKDVPSPLANINNMSEIDPKYIYSKLTQNFVAQNISAGSTSIYIPTNDYAKFPDRGTVILREVNGTITNPSLKYSTYVYYKGTNLNELKLIRRLPSSSSNDINSISNVGATFSTGYTNATGTGTSNNVFFGGCTTSVYVSDRWAYESPFLPYAENISEDVDLESATLYKLPQKTIPYTGSIDSNYTNNKVPNPYNSKALGVNLQNRNAVKTFQPLSNLEQAASWANQNFGAADSIELLIKPGYYRIGGANFVPSVKINGSGVSRTGGYSGKEIASVSAGNIGGYLNTDVNRRDSVYFFRSPLIGPNYGWRTNNFYLYSASSYTFKNGFDLNNIHFLGLSEAILENEILDSSYSDDATINAARKLVRRAYGVKKATNYPVIDTGVSGGLSFNIQTGISIGTGTTSIGKMEYYVNDSTVIDNSGAVVSAGNTTCRYVKFTLHSRDFNNISGSPTPRQKYIWAKNYIIPGTTLYFSSGNSAVTGTTPKTKILDVNIKNPDVTAPSSTSNESIEFYCAVYNSTNTKSNIIEDLVISDYIDGTTATIIILNANNDEFNSLVYNYLSLYRKGYLAKGFSTSGGFNVASKLDNFGNTITQYDTPRIVGVIPGYYAGTIQLVIDSNPTSDNIDPTTILTAFAPDYWSHQSILLPYTSDATEDFSVNLNYFPNGPLSYSVYYDPRYYILQITPSYTTTGVENDGISSTILNKFVNFTSTSLVDNGANIKSKNDYVVAAKSNLNAANCPYKLPASYKTLTGTITYNASTRVVTGTGTSFITEIQIGDAIYSGATGSGGLIGIVSSINAGTGLSVANNSLAYGTNISSTAFSKDINNTGKSVFINYPYNYRRLLKRFSAVTDQALGLMGTTMINAPGVTGSKITANLSNVTLGAQSPSSSLYSYFGGGYGGALINLSGSNLALNGLRIRGNNYINYNSLFALGNTTRAKNNYHYGNNPDLFQFEQTNNIASIGQFGSASILPLSKSDEQYKYLSEYRSNYLNYLEPKYNLNNNPVDYDQRVFPVSCYASVKRFATNGSLNTNLSITEKYITPNTITAASSTNATNSGWDLKISTGSSIINGDADGNLLPQYSLSFHYTDSSILENVFTGQYATKIVNPNNFNTTYAIVTGVIQNTNPIGSGVTNTARITYSGSIPNNTDIKFLTTYISSEKYNYVTTTTSRYQKDVFGGQSHLYLNTGYALSADVSVSGTGTTSFARQLVVFNNATNPSAPQFKAYVETDAFGQITSLDPTDFGTGTLSSVFGDILVPSVGTGLSGFTFTVQRNLNEDITIFNPGEYIAAPPANCFILNNISSLSPLDIKLALQQVKEVIKPYNYINYNGINYKIAKNSTNKSYIGVYKYANPNNLSDIRVSIVVRLDDPIQTPTYGANTRFDIFNVDNIFDYWPKSGKLLISNNELCDFTITGNNYDQNGYSLNLTRSMTKYFPSYIRDWQGLDPSANTITPNLLSGTSFKITPQTTTENFTALTFTLSDPIDISCMGLRRIYGSPTSNGLGTTSLGAGITCLTPTGIYTNALRTISIPSSNLTEDFEKYSTGNIITLPYRDISVNNWNSAVFTVDSGSGTSGTPYSSNKAGDLLITGSITTSTPLSWSDPNQKFHIVSSSAINYNIYNNVNAISLVGFADNRISISGTTTAQLVLTNALLSTIGTGTTFMLVPQFKTIEGTNPVKLFKSRIIDKIKDVTNNLITLILSDPAPDTFVGTESNMRHYGFITLNETSWTYPKVGGSALRPNNANPGTTTTNIYLPNNSGNIKIGDNITYTYDGGSCSAYITSIGTLTNNYCLCELNVVGGTHIIYNGYSNISLWSSLSDITIKHVSNGFVKDGPAFNKIFTSTTGFNLSFNSYSVWYENYNSYISAFNGIAARHGFVGNFAVNQNDSKALGLDVQSFSGVTWGAQYNTGIWTVATPFLPSWASTALSVNTIELDQRTNYDNNFINSYNKNPAYTSSDLSGGYAPLNPLVHTGLTTVNLFASLNTSNTDAGGIGAYDTVNYKFYSSPTLSFGVYGTSLAEIISTISYSNYKPALDFNSNATTTSKSITLGDTTVTGFYAGDVLYSSSKSYIGTVGSDGTTFVVPAQASSGGTVLSISPRYNKSLSISGSVASGSVGPNVMGNANPNYNKYNLSFNLNSRTYNSSIMLNTTGQLAATTNTDNGYQSVSIFSGDLMQYTSSILNVVPSKINPKVHTSKTFTVSTPGYSINI